MASQDFVSTTVLSEVQQSALIDLEPAFEHLLRDVGLEEGTILALRHCRINDREMFTGLADTREELRGISDDVGESTPSFLMAWKRTKAQVDVKTSTEALQKQHG